MPSKNPLISIGLPVYNGEKYLRSTLDSLLAQDFADFELILSDNASADNTENICREYAARDARIRYSRNSVNIGLEKNFRKVYEEARGKYFKWAACDDRHETGFLRAVIGFLESHEEVVLCGSSVRVIDENDKVIKDELLKDIYPEVPWKQARLKFFEFVYTNSYLAMYGIYRREALRGMRLSGRKFNNKSFHGGIETPLLTVLSGRGRIAALPEPLWSYRIHPDSLFRKECESFSPVERQCLNFQMALRVLWIALTVRCPLSGRRALINAALKNFSDLYFVYYVRPRLSKPAGVPQA